MTDTTDIAALRSKAANVIGLLTAESLTGSFALDSLADVFDDMFRLLEAERQRADKYENLHDEELTVSCNLASQSKQSYDREKRTKAELSAMEGIALALRDEVRELQEKLHKAQTELVVNDFKVAALKGDQVPVADKCHPSMMESVTVPHNVIGTYEDASGGRSDIVTLSDKREMKGINYDVIAPGTMAMSGWGMREFLAPQKPVVLPSLTIGEVMHRSGFDREYAEGWVSANDNAIREIKAAGGIVKDGE